MPEEILRKLAEGASSGDRARAIRAGWEVNVSPGFAANDEQYARFLRIGMRRAVAVGVIMAQMRAIARSDSSARLSELKLPTLVVHGTLDEMLPVQNGRMIAGLIQARSWRSSAGSATCSSGSSQSARPSWSVRTPPCMPDRPGTSS